MTSTPDDRSAPIPPLRWFVTGASGGLGRALVQVALEAGDTVVATVRRPDALRELADAHPGRLYVERLDVTDSAAVAATVSRVLAEHGHIDVVVNNAGYTIVGAAEELTDAELDHQLATLLHAPLQITRAFLGPMRERGGGRIIQISSLGGQVAFPASSAYHAGKWGLEGFTEAVAQEVAEFGVRLTIVEPGGMGTDFGANMRTAAAIGAYEHGGVGEFRRWLTTAGPEVFRADPAKVAKVIFNTTRDPEPPLRLALGADAYAMVQQALRGRLDALEAQRELAHSVAFTADSRSSVPVSG
jgi:NAD(P)-dependent dehydrogenase (short-subunit alcohol dehydrogenase family)